MRITKDILLKEIPAFREIMGRRDLTVKQVGDAYGGLLTEYCRYIPENDEDKEFFSNIMYVLSLEYDKRLAYRLAMGI